MQLVNRAPARSVCPESLPEEAGEPTSEAYEQSGVEEIVQPSQDDEFNMKPNLSSSMLSLAEDTEPLVQVKLPQRERKRPQRYADHLLFKLQTGNYATVTIAKPQL